MIPAPIPSDETERLAALRELHILDTSPEARFDFLTAITSRLLQVPIVLVSLVDSNRQWFKSCLGLQVAQTPRDISFCGHAIMTDDPFIISDATHDERFKDNPLVMGTPHIRFYAGIPLKTLSGHRVGTFCTIDSKPRTLSADELQLLKHLAYFAERELQNATLMDSYHKLEQANKNSEISVQAKAAFLANMSHEIRTPLNGILGLSDLLLETPMSAPQKHQLQTLRGSADSLLSLINDILDFSKIEAGRIQFESVPFSVRELSNSLIELFAPLAKPKGLRLLQSIDDTMPDMLCGDPHRLRQIITNLLGNALKFTAHGTIELHTSCREVAGHRVYFQIQVKDTGIGIPLDQQATIFDAFTQADASISRRFGGSGLGLSISAQLARLMGGGLSVRSTPGEGSAFILDLCLDQSNEITTSLPTVQESAKEVSPQTLRILLAEDNEVNQQVAVGFLKKRNHEIVIARNGREAVDLYQKQRFDIILMDQMMPEMDGFEATAQIRRIESKTNHRTPIVAMTANAMTGDRERCLAAGMDDYLSKPIRKTELFAIVDRLAANQASAREKAA